MPLGNGVLVTLDVCGIDAVLASRVCEQLQQTCGFAARADLLATSHTHSIGPVVAGNLRPMHYMLFEADRKLVDSYASFLIEKIVASVQQAQRDLQPSELRFGDTSESIAVNRRANPEKDVPGFAIRDKLLGPTDPASCRSC